MLWARKWVDLLQQQRLLLPADEGLKKAVTDVGLIYSIVTPFTSFVAVDQEKVNVDGEPEKVRQPLPTPEGSFGTPAHAHEDGDALAMGGAAPAPPPAPAGAEAKMAQSAPAQRGCGCATASSAPDLSLPLLLGLFVLLRVARRRRCG